MKNLYYAAILTLYDENCQIDEKAQRRYVQFLLDKGVRGFFPCGTSGEYTTLSREENLRLLQIVLEENKGRVPVIPCASTASLHNTVELIQEMEKLGIQEVSICPPYYTPLRQEDILDYYLHILQEVKVKVYLYNIPAFTNPLYMETFERLLEEPRIIGIKDSSGSMKTISRYVAAKSGKREDFKVMTGTDEMILPALCGGCFGSVSALSGIIPEVHNLLYDTYRSRLLTAQELQIKLAQLATECEKYVFPVGYKFALEARGFAMPSFRQNVAEHLEGENYGQTREQIHRLVKEILALAEEKKGRNISNITQRQELNNLCALQM